MSKNSISQREVSMGYSERERLGGLGHHVPKMMTAMTMEQRTPSLYAFLKRSFLLATRILTWERGQKGQKRLTRKCDVFASVRRSNGIETF